MYNLKQLAKEIEHNADLVQKVYNLCDRFRRVEESTEFTLERMLKYALTIQHAECHGDGCKMCDYTGMSLTDAEKRLHREKPVTAELRLCQCGHSRKRHTPHYCMGAEDDLPISGCSCKKFKEKDE